MIIIADSSSLIALAGIGMIENLNKLYDIIIPQSVYNEISVLDKPFASDLNIKFKN
jgi:predicted nucleic acid-binding protein